MAIIRIDVPDELYVETVEAYCAAHGYEAITGMDSDGRAIPNPQSKQAFFESRIAERVMAPIQDKRAEEMTKAHRSQEEQEQAQIKQSLRAKASTMRKPA